MAINKPTKPDVTLPENFGGIKTPYTDSQIESGYEDGIPQIVDGGNINYEKDATFKKLDYVEKIADVINNIPVGNYLGVDTNNKFQYYDASTRNSYGNIGDIKYTMRTDLPYGGAWCDGTLYTKAQLPDLYTMLTEGKLLTKTLDEYNALVTSNGSCGFFGLDEANERFKVPTIKDVYLKVGDANLAEFSAESLPNITGRIGNGGSDLYGIFYPNSPSGAFTLEKGGKTLLESVSGYTDRYIYANFNASNSSPTYQDGAKVNPDHICYRAYVVVYTAVEDDTMATWNMKANDSDVVHKTGDEIITGAKTFSTSNNAIWLREQGTWSEAPEATDYNSIIFQDLGFQTTATIQTISDTSNNKILRFAIKNKSYQWIGVPLDVCYQSDGSQFVRFPTPANAAENSTMGATTAWVNSRITTLMDSQAVGFIDPTNSVSFSAGTTITAPYNCYVTGSLSVAQNNSYADFYINNVHILRQFAETNQRCISVMCVPVKAGQTFKVVLSSNAFLTSSYYWAMV